MTTASNIPSPSAPFLDPSGRISQVWFQFLVSLFSRTGSAQGVDMQALQGNVSGMLAQSDAGSVMTDEALRARVADLEAEVATLQAQAATPAGYATVTIAGVARTIPYY